MRSFTDALLIAREEIASTFRGRKGLLLVLSLLGLAVTPAVWRLIGQHGAQAVALQRAHTAALVRIYDADIARALLDCPPAIAAGAVAMFFFQPLFVLVAGSDRLAADIDTHAIRYWTVRASRSAVVAGKWLGLWAVVSIITAFALAAISALAIVDAPREWATSLRWGGATILYAALTALVYVSLCTFLGVLVARPRVVLVSGLVVLFILRAMRATAREHGASTLGMLFPGGLDQLLLSPAAASKAIGLGVVAMWSVAFLVAAAIVFDRRAI